MKPNSLPYLIAVLFLSGCVGPNYKRPCIHMPEQFKHGIETNTKAALITWWEKFNDPYLNDLIKRATKNNYDLRIALERVEQVRDLYCIQEARLWPVIGPYASASRTEVSFDAEQETLIPIKTYSDYTCGLSASWEIDVFGKLRRAREAAYADYEAQQELARDVYVIMLADVARTYIDIKAAQQKVSILGKKIRTDTTILTLLRDRFTSGINSDIPTQQYIQELQEDKNQKTSLEIQLKHAINRLAILLGEQPEQFIFESKQKKIPAATDLVKTGLPSDLLRQRPDIRAAERQLAAATARIGQAMAEWFPTFSFLGNVGNESNMIKKLFSAESATWSFGLDVTCPLFNCGRIRFNIKAKKSVEKQALLLYEQTINKALEDVENGLIAYFQDRARHKILSTKANAVTRELGLIRAKFESGLDNQLSVLTTENKVWDIELQLSEVQQAVSSDLIAVYKALGGGW